jgi:ribonuclease Y
VDILLSVVAALIALGAGIMLGITLHKAKLKATFEGAQSESERILMDAQTERDKIIQAANNEAKEEIRKRKAQFDNESRNRRQEISKLENKIKQREQSLEKKLSILDSRELELNRLTSQMASEELKYKSLIQQCEQTLEQNRKTLEQIANLSQEEAKRQLIKSLEADARAAAQETIKKIEESARQEGAQKAQSMVSLAVQRVSSEYVNDSTVTVVGLPSDEMKGRIIGREGRNIRALEQATGVDLIIDDTPEAVILSCFNPIRREIAHVTIKRLIADGRIHPARIEETVSKVKEEFNQVILENGEQAAFDTGITDLPTDILHHLGKLKYRTTGQQTVLQHSVEVAHICAIMASEMGIDVKKAKRAGLLHDIGKSVDQEHEGHHSILGADLLKKYHESDEILTAIRSHHDEDLDQASPLTVVLHAANILSANRPGARKEILETYIKRLEDMEKMVNTFEGIESSYVIQAGKEIRALVTPSLTSDVAVTELTNDIAFRLRKEMTFPGQVKVTVVKESKHIEFAQ